MLGMPTFDLTSERGKQDFQKWITFAIKNEINSYSRQVLNIDNTGAGGGGGSPTGPAGGGLTGEYPDPLIYPDMTGITSISTPQIISFNTINPGVAAIGALVWNDTNGTLEFGLKGGNVNLSIGQENVALVKHADNAGLVKGKVVYVAGSDGSNKTVRYARANAEATSSRTFGVMAESATGGNKAFVATQGIVSDINTSALTEGAAVYVSPDVAGDLTSTKPSAPNHIVLVGFCIRSHSVNGVLYVTVVNGFELDELHDVKITSKQNGDIIKYNSSTGLWENAAADDIPAHASTHGVSGSDPVTIDPSQVTGTAVITSDSRLSDARTPTAHASTHIPGGSDALDLTKIIAIGSSLPTLPNALYPAGTLFGVGAAPPYLLYRSNGSTWQQIGGAGGGITVSDSAPASPSADDLWYNSLTGRTYIYYDSFWVEVGNSSYDTTLDELLPAGILVPTATSVEPSGWLFCYGQSLNSVSNPQYARLFSAIGTTYGGSGASSFVVPDLRGRTPFGKDNMGGTAANRITTTSGITGTVLGAIGGDERLHSHNHTQASHSHSVGYIQDSLGETAGMYHRTINDHVASGDAGGAGGGGSNAKWIYGSVSTVTPSINANGSGNSQNIPPAIILNYIIKL